MSDLPPVDSESLNRFLCIPLSANFTTLLLCGSGIFLCFIAAGISQEALVRDYAFTYSSFLTFETKIVCVLWALLSSSPSALLSPRSSHRSLLLLGVCSFFTMYFSNESLKYLNYPSQIVWKSSKILPVMLVSALFYRQTYLAKEIIAALLLFLSLVLFTAIDMKLDLNFSFLGIVWINLALLADSFIGSIQTSVMHQTQPSSAEMLFFPNLYAAIFSAIFSIGSGEFVPSLEWFTHSPSIGPLYTLIYAGSNLLGSYFILYSLHHFGVYLTTFLTSLRKAATILFSFLLFEKPFHKAYLIGYGLLSVSIWLNMQSNKEKQLAKQREKEKTTQNEAKKRAVNLTNGSAPGESAVSAVAAAAGPVEEVELAERQGLLSVDQPEPETEPYVEDSKEN